jgi:hypothetical protein
MAQVKHLRDQAVDDQLVMDKFTPAGILRTAALLASD